jgi:Tat protein secretion system quality control protein TatD with DNase activity
MVVVLIDTHSHIQRDAAASAAAAAAATTMAAAAAAAAANQAQSEEEEEEGERVLHCPMAVEEGDWAALASLGTTTDGKDIASYGLGIHPWKAHQAAPGWESRLEAALKAHPEALVGECGLDKAARTPDTGQVEWEAQLACFHAQLRLAASLGRPVSVHCVRAHGAVYEHLKQAEARGEATPPTVALHSYTGSPELAVSLLK